MTREENYHALLMEYASGCLDEAQALIVATHISLSPYAHKLVTEYESIGGSMLKDCCTPVAMKSDALKRVMGKIEAVGAPQSCMEKLKKKCGEKDLPTCLESYMQERTWTASREGHAVIHVKTTCCGYTAQLMRVAPDRTLETPSHNRVELTVVLEGAFIDETTTYRRGDLMIVERNNHKPVRAHEKQGAVCFIVRPVVSPFKQITTKIFSRFYPKD